MGAIAPPSRKNLPFLKEYKNQSKLYGNMNGMLVLALFFQKLVISYNQQCHIGTNVHYLSAIIISMHTILSFAEL